MPVRGSYYIPILCAELLEYRAGQCGPCPQRSQCSGEKGSQPWCDRASLRIPQSTGDRLEDPAWPEGWEGFLEEVAPELRPNKGDEQDRIHVSLWWECGVGWDVSAPPKSAHPVLSLE